MSMVKQGNDMLEDRKKLLSGIPAVSKILDEPVIEDLCENYPRDYVHNCVRRAVDEIRDAILYGETAPDIPNLPEIALKIKERVRKGLGHQVIRAINGAGVILHTGLGRSPLSPTARESLNEATERYAILATMRETGKRGDRNRHTDELLQELTGAESSLIVNNNSAAVMLALNTFGNGREAIVSRGELVEIGGAFRVPDVMERSGVRMVEVGTTNKTHLRDYRTAITEDTAFLLKVHTSNYRIEGFHQEVDVADMAKLAHENEILLLMDIGSGALIDLRKWGLEYEPTVPEAVRDGADVVTFSGDKLLGGPQCGVIVGKKDVIDRMKRNPLARALRCDKLILSALEGTLKLFLDPDNLPEKHPIYGMMASPQDVVKRRARRIARRIREITGNACRITVTEGLTEMGSGALPARAIPSWVVSLQPTGITPQQLGTELRLSDPPLFTRIEDEKVIIDARTIADGEVSMIAQNFRRVISEKGNSNSWAKLREGLTGMKPTQGKHSMPALG